jgi:hypothetical protein
VQGHQAFRNRSGSFAKLAAIRRASSRVSSLAARSGRILAVALRKFHVGERFLLWHFRQHSVRPPYRVSEKLGSERSGLATGE